MLVALSGVFGLLVAFRRHAYGLGIMKSYRASIPVLSVGNLTVGGTGKTPVVDVLVRRCLKAGKRVAVVSRGYGGRRQQGTALVSDGRGLLNDDARLVGDEPVLLARRNPQAMVIVARRRSEGVILAEKLGAQMVLLDDGFQHLALERDFDIVLLDAHKPFGNHRLMPAGPLREPPKSLNRADLVILTRCDSLTLPGLGLPMPVLAGSQTLSDELYSLSLERVSWEQIKDLRCVAFAGIARPEGFFTALREKGLTLTAEIAFSDHQDYDERTLLTIRAACEQADVCLTTEKDAVKLKPADLPIPCYAVPLDIRISPEQDLEACLNGFLQ